MRNALFASLAPAVASAAAAASLFAAAPAAHAQHADIVATVANGRVQTGGHVDATGEELPGLRVFAYDFAEDPLDPYFAGDPGFNSPAGSLPAGSQLRFNVLGAPASGLPANLAYWNGAGSAVTLTGAPGGETLRLNFGAQNVTAGTGTTTLPGFAIGTADALGAIHRHLNSFLNGSDGNNLPGDGVEPAAGIYVLALELTSSDAGVQASLPFWIVYNNGLTEAAHDRAIEYVQGTLVPEPAGLTLAGVAAVGLLARRRRQCYAGSHR